MALLDVNVLVALAWDAHIHHAAAWTWFAGGGQEDWQTCPMTETGFVRVSSNPKVLPNAITVHDAVATLGVMRGWWGHSFLADDVSPTDVDVPALSGHRQVTDAHLLTLARRAGVLLVTFDRALSTLAGNDGVELLRAL